VNRNVPSGATCTSASKRVNPHATTARPAIRAAPLGATRADMNDEPTARSRGPEPDAIAPPP
jgi:hypothetical protein